MEHRFSIAHHLTELTQEAWYVCRGDGQKKLLVEDSLSGIDIKINQKIHLLKTGMTHSVTLPTASWRYRREERQQPCMGSEKENHSGCLCPLFEQCYRGGKEEWIEWGGTRGSGDKREEVSHSCPAWGPKYVALSSSRRHQLSALASHYFTSHRAHTPFLRHTRVHSYTAAQYLLF